MVLLLVRWVRRAPHGADTCLTRLHTCRVDTEIAAIVHLLRINATAYAADAFWHPIKILKKQSQVLSSHRLAQVLLSP